MLVLGAHMSIAGGHEKAIERAEAFSMAACQIFTKNANQWNAKAIDPAAAERFLAAWQASGVQHLVAHDSYLINLASPNDALWEKSRLAFQNELDRCDLLGVPSLVSHPGVHMGSGVEAGVARVAAALNQIYRERPNGKTVTLLETTAGQGTALGRSFEEIAAIIGQIDEAARVAVCFDTCHTFAAGYDLRDQAGFDATMQQFDAVIGLDQLKVFHLNDSKKGLGAYVDRHAAIGEGELGLEAFRCVMNDPRFAGIPGILETPKGDDGEEDRRNLATLHGLVGTQAVPSAAHA